MLRVTCEKCDREGSYRVNGLNGTRGDGKIIDWLDELTAPKKSAHNMNDPCGAPCLVLGRLFWLSKLGASY
jgi:hypothetical protein